MIAIVSQLSVELEAQKVGTVKVTLEGSIALRKKVKNPPPEYPKEALDDSVQGTVRVQVIVSKAGTVTGAKVDTSSGSKLLDNAALACVKSWVFGKSEKVDTGVAVFQFIIGSQLPGIDEANLSGLESQKPALDLTGKSAEAKRTGFVKVGLRGPLAVRKKVKNPPPEYPKEALDDSVQGTVRVQVIVSKAGTVTGAKIDTSSGSKLLDNAALACVKSWVFGRADVVDTGLVVFQFVIGSQLPQAGEIYTGGLQAPTPDINIGEAPRPLPAIAKVTTKVRKPAGVEIREKQELSYPKSAKEKWESGTVTLRVYLKKNGVLDRVEVVSSSGKEQLDNAAVNNVKSWRYYTEKEEVFEVDYIFELK